jgi:hypothetical protein
MDLKEELKGTEDAALSALTPKELGEVKLFAYSLMRQAIAIDLCGPQGVSFFNAVITVWVCTLSPRDALAAHDDPVTAQQAAFDWATAQGYSFENFMPVLDLYRKLQLEITASTNARSKSGEEPPKNDGGQPTSLKLQPPSPPLPE